MISFVFNGDKDLSLEMASLLSDFLGLNVKEERYFFLLVEFARAGTHQLKVKLKGQLTEAQQAANKISERVAKDKELTSEEKATYYSSWAYTGVRNVISIPRDWTSEDIAHRLLISEGQVREVLQFLLDHGLIRLTNGRYEVLAKATHIGADHALVAKHHQNWRVRGLQKMDQRDPENLFYTGPMSLSQTDAGVIRDLLLEFVQKAHRIVGDSPSETVRCLNIDWFNY